MRKPKNIEIFIIVVCYCCHCYTNLVGITRKHRFKKFPLWVAGLLASENDNIIFSTDGINWKDAPKT